MKYALVTFRLITLAQKGESVLHKAGYRCNIRRTPRWMEEQGCGYSIQIPYADAQDCVEILRENKMMFRKVYLLRDNGNVEELTI